MPALCVGALAVQACGGSEPATATNGATTTAATTGTGHGGASSAGGTGPGAGGQGGAVSAGGAGGVGGSGPAIACDRASASRTADVALFDELVVALGKGSPPGPAVDAFLADVAASGGTPLTRAGSDDVVFVVRGEPEAEWSVSGSWNDWTPGVLTMSRVGTSDLFAATTALSQAQRFEYKLVDGPTYLEDKLAKNVAWDGIDHQDVGELNGVVRPENGDPTKGRLVAWRGVQSKTLGNARDVFVYLPAAYDAPSCPRLPAIDFHDGNESVARVPFQESADLAYAATPDASAVLVFVALADQNDRMAEYTFGPDTKGDAYVTFLRDELHPLEDARLRLCPKARDRGLAGASLGGLISFYGAFQAPDTFGFVGSQSGSFFWEDNAMVTRAGADPVLPLRIYLDNGCPDDNCDETQAVYDALMKKAYDVEHIIEPGGVHDWAYWQKRLPGLLTFFRDGRQGCAK